MAPESYEQYKKRHLDRPRGIFTQKDREYMFGELDQSTYDDPDNADRQRRYQMRQRLRNTILDFPMFAYDMPWQDRRRVMEELDAAADEELAAEARGDPTMHARPILASSKYADAWGAILLVFFRNFGLYHPGTAAWLIEWAIMFAYYWRGYNRDNAYTLYDVTLNIEKVHHLSKSELEDLSVPEDLPDDPSRLDWLLRGLRSHEIISTEEYESLRAEHIQA